MVHLTFILRVLPYSVSLAIHLACVSRASGVHPKYVCLIDRQSVDKLWPSIGQLLPMTSPMAKMAGLAAHPLVRTREAAKRGGRAPCGTAVRSGLVKDGRSQSQPGLIPR